MKDTAVTRKVAHILEDGSDSGPLCAWLNGRPLFRVLAVNATRAARRTLTGKAASAQRNGDKQAARFCGTRCKHHAAFNAQH